MRQRQPFTNHHYASADNHHSAASTNNDQPNMRAALDNLNAANVYLDRASDNKGGHKAKAQTLIKLAIGEVRAA